MKSYSILPLLAVITLTALGQSPAPPSLNQPKPPFTLEVSANPDVAHDGEWDFKNGSKVTVKVGSAIYFAVRKTNVSDAALGKWTGAASGVEVRDSSGGLVKPREREPNEAVLGGGPARLAGTREPEIRPGESSIEPYSLSGRFDLNRPGVYSVQVWERISADPASNVVKSNIITIMVTE